MGWPPFQANHTSSTAMAMPSSAFSGCWPRKISGEPVTRPCSLAKATIEPVKVMAPITVPSPISIRLCILILPGEPMPKASGETKAAAATNTAASPTSEWNAATSCGSAVIWMRQATTAPTAPPTNSPPMISHGETTPGVATVTPIATTMPTMPNRLPWREVTGEESPRSAMMKQMAEIR